MNRFSRIASLFVVIVAVSRRWKRRRESSFIHESMLAVGEFKAITAFAVWTLEPIDRLSMSGHTICWIRVAFNVIVVKARSWLIALSVAV